MMLCVHTHTYVCTYVSMYVCVSEILASHVVPTWSCHVRKFKQRLVHMYVRMYIWTVVMVIQ